MKRLAIVSVTGLIGLGLVFSTIHRLQKPASVLSRPAASPIADIKFENPKAISGNLDQKFNVRPDILAWINSKNFKTKELKNSFINLAAADQLSLSYYDSKDEKMLNKISSEIRLRTACTFQKLPKNQDVQMIAEMRRNTYNTKDRTNAFRIFMNRPQNVHFKNTDCRPFYDGFVTPSLTDKPVSNS
jgi:hypothetical protein